MGDPKLPMKNSTSKPQVQLVPPAAIIEMAKCFEAGIAKGYNGGNWRFEHSPPIGVYCGKVMRHIAQYLDGEDIDPETGLLHIVHAMSDLAILVDALLLGRAVDDRYPAGPASKLMTIKGDKDGTTTS